MRDIENEGWTTRDEALVAQNEAGTAGCWLLFPEDEADEDEGAPSAPGGFVWVAAER